MSLKHKKILTGLIVSVGVVFEIIASITNATIIGILSSVALIVAFPMYTNIAIQENRETKGQGDGSVVTSEDIESVD